MKAIAQPISERPSQVHRPVHAASGKAGPISANQPTRDITGKTQRVADQLPESFSIPQLKPGIAPTEEQLNAAVALFDKLTADPHSGFGLPFSSPVFESLLIMVVAAQLLRINSIKLSSQSVKLSSEMADSEKTKAYEAASKIVGGAIASGVSAVAIESVGFAAQLQAGANEVGTEMAKNRLDTHVAQAEHLKANISTAQTTLAGDPNNQNKADVLLNSRVAFGQHARSDAGLGQRPKVAAVLDMGQLVDEQDHAALHNAHLQDVEAEKNTLAGQANKHKLTSAGLQTASHSFGQMARDIAKSVPDKAHGQLSADAAFMRNLRDILLNTGNSQGKGRDDADSFVHQLNDAIKSYNDNVMQTRASIASHC